MRDRYVEHPNRFRVVPVPDEENVVDLIPEPGEVYDEGTLWLKGTFLADSTAKQLGLSLSSDPGVNDALLALYMHIKGGRIVRLHITCGGKPAIAGIPISGAVKLDGSPLVTDGASSINALVIGEPSARLTTPDYLDMAAGSLTIDTTEKDIADVSWVLPTPTAGTKVFAATSTFQFSPYATTYDLCCVGAGGGGTNAAFMYAAFINGSAGGGGYVSNRLNIAAVANKTYTATVGLGGAGVPYNGGNESDAQDGGPSSLRLGTDTILSAAGGKGSKAMIRSYYNRYTYGGAGNGAGGSDGDDRTPKDGVAGSVRRFGEASGVLYSGGGASGGNGEARPTGGAPYGGNGGYWVKEQKTGIDSDDEEYTYFEYTYHKAEGGKGPGGGGGGGVARHDEKPANADDNQSGGDGYRGEVAVRWRISM